MRRDARVLVIGTPLLRDDVGRALPDCETAGAATALAGVWQAGQERFDAIFLEVSPAARRRRALRSLRRVNRDARIVAVCSAAHEPTGRRALLDGADDYVLAPLRAHEVESALAMDVRPPMPPEITPPAPTDEEKSGMVTVLQNLHEGPQAALQRLAAQIQKTFAARYVSIRVDDLSASVGTAESAVLRQSITRGNSVVGTITLGRPRDAGYAAFTTTRLAEYARLIDAVVSVAHDRAHWQQLAWTDDLSQLHNRRYLERRLGELISTCTRQRAYLTVLLFDIDDFKHYNDRYGHDTGDGLIREVAQLLVRCSRESDLVSRFGGDEFAVVFWDSEEPRVPGSRHPEDPMVLAERFRGVIGSHSFKCLGPDAPGPVTISGGLASFPWDGNTPAQLLRAADQALLAAKREGKNRIQLAEAPGGDRTSMPFDGGDAI